jgi:hypothetical protein
MGELEDISKETKDIMERYPMSNLYKIPDTTIVLCLKKGEYETEDLDGNKYKVYIGPLFLNKKNQIVHPPTISYRKFENI